MVLAAVAINTYFLVTAFARGIAEDLSLSEQLRGCFRIRGHKQIWPLWIDLIARLLHYETVVFGGSNGRPYVSRLASYSNMHDEKIPETTTVLEILRVMVIFLRGCTFTFFLENGVPICSYFLTRMLISTIVMQCNKYLVYFDDSSSSELPTSTLL